MRIVITGASGHVGRHLLSALEGSDYETIALVREETELPANHVISDWLNSKDAEEAIWESQFIVHLAGALEPPDGDHRAANVVPTERVLSSLAVNKQQRIVYLSCVGADTHSRNPYLAAKGKAEDLLTHGIGSATIFRCGPIIGAPEYPGPSGSQFLAHENGKVTVLGSGRQRVRPIYVGDVVTAILAALQSRHNGMFPLGGPDEMSVDELVRLLNSSQRFRLTHIPGIVARILPMIDKHVSPTAVDYALMDRTADIDRTVKFFHLELTSLREIWQRTPAAPPELSAAV